MKITRTTHAGQPAVSVEAKGTIWTYQLDAGAFSSLRDPDGEEWIGFAPGEPRAPAGAANVFRGIPNLVFPENVGHPGYATCESEVVDAGDAVLISTESRDGDWAWQWKLRPDRTHFKVLRVPPDRPYWFLYEGTPAGRFEPEAGFWGSDSEGARQTAPDIFGEAQRLPTPAPAGRSSGAQPQPVKPDASHRDASGDAPGSVSGAVIGPRRWAYFGHRASPRVLLLVHETASCEPSFFAYMRANDTDGMVVFGFGRDHGDRPRATLEGAHEFTVRFVESRDHEEIARTVEQDR